MDVKCLQQRSPVSVMGFTIALLLNTRVHFTPHMLSHVQSQQKLPGTPWLRLKTIVCSDGSVFLFIQTVELL